MKAKLAAILISTFLFLCVDSAFADHGRSGRNRDSSRSGYGQTIYNWGSGNNWGSNSSWNDGPRQNHFGYGNPGSWSNQNGYDFVDDRPSWYPHAYDTLYQPRPRPRVQADCVFRYDRWGQRYRICRD